MNLLNLCTTLLILLLPLLDGSDTKSWHDLKLTVGPRLATESGRYVYNASIGGRVHCHYCERKALVDSTYSFLQQKLCIANYRHDTSITNQVSTQEKDNALYPICVIGTVPGCGPPPEDNKANVHMWQCDPGYSNELYSVYFSCALICNRTDQVVRSYYCNESLRWEAEPYMRPSQPCELPPEPSVATEVNPMKIIIGSFVAVFVVILAVVLTCFCYRRRKLPTPPDGHKPDPNIEEGKDLHNDARRDVPPVSIVDDTLNIAQSAQTNPKSRFTSRTSSNLQDSYSGESSDQLHPLLHDASTGTDSSSHGEEDGEGAIGRSPHLNVPFHIPNPAHSTQHSRDKPDIKIIYWKDNTHKQSVPMQGGHYSIEKGWDFYIIPNSTGGHSVREFKVERKGEGRPFRGTLEMQFWNTVYCATEYDAGLFTWKMLLDNSCFHEGSFEIYIMLPDMSSTERPVTDGEEMHRPPPRVKDTASDVTHLDIESMLSDKNVKPVRQLCSETLNYLDNHNPLCNAPPLSSNMYNERNYTHSGLSNSCNSRNFLRMHSGHLDNNIVRSEDMRYSTSGYESQRSSEIDQERFNANFVDAPKLNINSIMRSRNMSSNSLSGNKSHLSLSHVSSVQNSSDLLSEIPEHANHEQFRGELDEIPMGTHDKSFENQMDDLPMDESFGDQVDRITTGTQEEPFEDQLDGIPLSGRPDPVGHTSEVPCRDSRVTDENTLRKEIVTSEDSEANCAMPTIEQHGAIPTTEQHSAMPTTKQHSAVPTTKQHGAVPTTKQHSVSDSEDNRIDTNDQIQPQIETQDSLDSLEIELQDYSTEEPAERDHESRM